MMKIGSANVELDASKIIHEDENELVLPGVLAREGILRYPQGKAFRPADELKSSLFTFEGAWVVQRKHPETWILTDPGLISGRVDGIAWDEERHEVHGHVHIDKSKAKPEFLATLKAGIGKNSIGFLYEEDWTKGEFNGQPYDYVQRKILIDHIAVGVPNPRDPECVLGVDADDFSSGIKIGLDPWETTEDYIRSGHKEASDTCRTIDISEEQGIKAIYCKYGEDWSIQSYLFSKAKGWSEEKAKSWFAEHKSEVDAVWEAQSINDLPDSCFAFIEDGGKKDEDGKTVPRSLRHLPFKNAQGQVDHDHLVNALARVKQAGTMPEGGKSSAIEKLCSAVRSWNREHSDSKIESEVCGTAGDAFCELERSRRLLKS